MPGERWGMREAESTHSSRMDYLLVFLLTLPALYPLLGAGIFASHDGLHHIFRLFDLLQSLRDGAAFPRWLPNLGFGYGYPLLNYYAPLAYYLALPFMALGSAPILAIKIVYMLGFFGASFGMYTLGRPFLGRAGAVLAAAAYTYLPYHLADAYVRGALPEFLSFALIPFILWAIYRTIADESVGATALAGLGLAALVLTHNLATLLAAPVMALFALALAWRLNRPKRLGWLGVAALLALLITAFYWLPALSEVSAIRASQTHHDPDLIRSQLTPMLQSVSPYFLYRYFPDQGRPIEHPFGLVAIVLALGGLAFSLWRWRRLQPLQRLWVAACGVTVLVAAFMMWPASAWLWRTIPGLPYVQFPWRWQLIASLGSAGLIGCWMMEIRRPTRSWELQPGRLEWAIVLGFATLAAVAGLVELPRDLQRYPGQARILEQGDVSLEGMAAYEYELFLATRLWNDPKSLEYVPVWVTEPVTELILPSARPAPSADAGDPALTLLVVEQHAPTRVDLRVTAAQDTSIRLHSFYFPGWRARVDGQPVETYPSSSLGLLTLDVPAGEHQVSIRFANTLSRWIGVVLSLAAALGVSVWLIASRRGRVVAYFLIAIIVLGGIWWWQGDRQEKVSPRPVWVNFADQFALAGYQLTPPSNMDGALDLDIWWVGLTRPAEDYKVFVHVDDEAGQRWAQHDTQPLFGMAPTTRWEVNELVRDHYRLELPADLPPGEYQIFVGLYPAESALNLDVLDEMKNAQGQRFLLDRITLP
jgi:hypothetical protein